MISAYLNIVQMDGTLSGSPPESNHVDQEAEQRGSSRAAARLIASWLMSNERKWIQACIPLNSPVSCWGSDGRQC